MVWGGYTNHLGVGASWTWDAYDTFTPSINVYVTVWVRTDSSWSFNDSQTLVLSGSAGGSWTFQNTQKANEEWQIATVTIPGQGQSYGGGPTYSFHLQLNGVYLGAGPALDFAFALPPRPIRAPSPPGGPLYGGITANGVQTVSWGLPADQGGSGVDGGWLQVGTSNFGGLVYDVAGAWVGRTLTGLAPGTTYYGRTAAHNAAGWSGWSGVTSFTTSSAATGAPTISGVNPDSFTVNWTAPSDTPPTGYQLQVATNSGFTAGLQTLTGTSWATSRVVTGLTPATTYYARVQANTAGGYGAWSATASATTLSGAKVMSGGQWVNGVAWVRQNGAWVLAKVNKRVSGAWQI
jgi:hypothetical protein